MRRTRRRSPRTRRGESPATAAGRFRSANRPRSARRRVRAGSRSCPRTAAADCRHRRSRRRAIRARARACRAAAAAAGSACAGSACTAVSMIVLGELPVQHLHECPQRAGVAQCAMPVGQVEAVARHQRVQSVPLCLRKQAARQAHRAQRSGAERSAGARIGVLEEAVVEAGVVRDEHAVGDPLGDLARRRRRTSGAPRPSRR